jgi:hypothetical protein
MLTRLGSKSVCLTLALPVAAAFAALPSACGRPPTDAPGGTSAALGGSAPPLGVAATFAVLGATTVTNTGPTTISGDLGVNPGLAITGFPPGVVVAGTTHAGDATSLQAQSDATLAYDALAAEPCSADLTGIDLGGLTLAPGVYCFSSSAQLTGTLVLDAQGTAGAVFVFKTVSTLTTASDASVRMINGGDPCGVFWQVGSSAVLGTSTVFSGSILALTSISLATGATVSGRALARNGAVTMDSDTVTAGNCAAAGADAGALDAGSNDSGVSAPDAGVASQPDAGGIASPPDAGVASQPDAGAIDACVEDASPPEEIDAGPPDTGAPDQCN